MKDLYNCILLAIALNRSSKERVVRCRKSAFYNRIHLDAILHASYVRYLTYYEAKPIGFDNIASTLLRHRDLIRCFPILSAC